MPDKTRRVEKIKHDLSTLSPYTFERPITIGGALLLIIVLAGIGGVGFLTGMWNEPHPLTYWVAKWVATNMILGGVLMMSKWFTLAAQPLILALVFSGLLSFCALVVCIIVAL